MRRILHPTDFSNGARQAETEAVRLARAMGAKLLLLHVVPEVYLYARGRVKITDLLQLQAIRLAAGRRALAHRVARLRSRGVRVKGLVLSGSPPAQILAVARRARSDIIVMGTRGGNALSRWLLGSVADRVVRGASCPVLTVRK